MNIAYNAALRAATAALHVSGYRAAREGQHYRVIQSLRETICADVADVATFDAFRKKRNITEYERVGLVSDADARQMRELAVRIRDDVVAWLKKNHHALMK